MTILDQFGSPLTPPPEGEVCDHGIKFDEVAAEHLSVAEIRKRWPRLWGNCPLGCGFNGTGYASWKHYIMGDW